MKTSYAVIPEIRRDPIGTPRARDGADRRRPALYPGDWGRWSLACVRC